MNFLEYKGSHWKEEEEEEGGGGEGPPSWLRLAVFGGFLSGSLSRVLKRRIDLARGGVGEQGHAEKKKKKKKVLTMKGWQVLGMKPCDTHLEVSFSISTTLSSSALIREYTSFEIGFPTTRQ